MLFSLLLLLGLAACRNTPPAQPQPAPQPETSIAPQPAAADTTQYACPMHPEVKGKKGDKCPKCKMELSVKL